MALAFVRLIPSDTNIQFVRLRKPAFIFSTVLLLGSILAVMMLGFNLGIDFKGGGNIELSTEGPADLDKIGTIVRELDLGEVEVRNFGSPNDVLVRFERQEAKNADDNVDRLQQDAAKKVHLALYQFYSDIKIEFDGDRKASITAPGPLNLPMGQEAITSLGIQGLSLISGEDENTLFLELPIVERDRKIDPKYQQELFEKARYRLFETYSTIRSEGTEIVGPKVSGELVKSGITAVFGALFCMLLYIWFRFEWQFSVGAVLALSHDVILTAGMFAVTQIEFNLASIAAILTIVGYSMNDTVVVYDRIREKMRKYNKMSLADLIDLAINKTLSRTSITSLTTLLALASLYFLGGESLRGFAATMIWGVIVGTYSSIFIAAPLLLMLGVNRDALEET